MAKLTGITLFIPADFWKVRKWLVGIATEGKVVFYSLFNKSVTIWGKK